MSYADTILIDASRQQSEEFKGGNKSSNKSDYTNKTGVGITLNQGDKVSIHSGYISRRGCGADTIELTGRKTGRTIDLTASTEKQYQKQINPQDYFGLNIPAENYGQVAEVYGCEVVERETSTYDVSDNEAYFNISYYKTTNGEGYFHLPRRFDALKQQFYDDTTRGPITQHRWTGLFHPSFNVLAADNHYAESWIGAGDIVRPPFDCFAHGQNTGANAQAGFNIRTADKTNVFKYAYSNNFRRCLADTYFYQEAQRPGFTSQAGGATGIGFSNTGTGHGANYTSVFWKKKNDNSRYTLYQKDISYHTQRLPRKWFVPNVRATLYNEDTGDETRNNTPSRDDYASVDDAQIWLERRDPAMSEYVKYEETKKIGVEPGNYSPGDLASEFTDQLNLTQEPKYIVGSVATDDYPTAVDPTPSHQDVEPLDKFADNSSMFIAKQVIVSTTTEGETYKKFHTATSVSVEKKAYVDFIEGNSLDPDDDSYHRGDEQTAINYLSGFKSIGIKRPELFEAGRKIMKEMGYRYIGYNNGNTLSLGDYNNLTPFDWTEQKPPTTDTDTAGTLHGGDIYQDTEANRISGVVGKESGWSFKQMINPYIVNEIEYADNEGEIVTSWNWTTENLNKLRDFFIIQGKYPELFEGILLEDSPTVNEATYETGITNKNARFLHINARDSFWTGVDHWKNKLGTDFYSYDDITVYDEGQSDAIGIGLPDTNPKSGQLTWGSDALFFYYDESRKDIAGGGNTDKDLYYGLFVKRQGTNPHTGNIEDFITITTEKLGGIPEYYFDRTTDGTDIASHISKNKNRTIGFDCHFCAYGTSCISLYAGYLSGQIKDLYPTGGQLTHMPVAIGDTNKIASTTYPFAVSTNDVSGNITQDVIGGDVWTHTTRPIHQFIKYRYVGAENPAIVFDESESKFSFQKLHTPERVGNINNAGQSDDNPIVADTNSEVYFVNKRLLLREYCPDMYPYSRLNKSVVPDQNKQLTTYTSYFNNNITPYSIMDADCGIFIEDFGYEFLSDKDWDNSLWGMLGFTRNQFYSSNQALSRQTRINNTITTDNIGKPTTNANVEPADLQQLITNTFGAELRTQQLPLPMNSIDYSSTGKAQESFHNIDFPGATIEQKSSQINASKLPIKTKKPYLLIKSDIINDTKYLGSTDSGVSLPIIGVIDKNGASTDFFFGSGQTQFTITQQKTISSIRTQILNPNGSLAELDDDTSIIYQIEKQNTGQLGVAEQILQAQQQQAKKSKK